MEFFKNPGIKIDRLEKELKDAKSKLAMRDDELRNRSSFDGDAVAAKERALELTKAQQAKAFQEADELRKKNMLLESRVTELEKLSEQQTDQLYGLQSSHRRSIDDADTRQRDFDREIFFIAQERDQLRNELHLERERATTERDRTQVQTDNKIASLTKERDQAKNDRDNHEIRANALHYAHRRKQKELDDANQQASEFSPAQREVLDQRRRDLEAQTAALAAERDTARKERDQASTERDNHELRTRALEYSQKRDKKAAADAAQVEKDGIRQAHEALLQYHNHAKKDWASIHTHLQHENDALRMARQALNKSYYDIVHLPSQNRSLTQERDLARQEANNHELRARALEYSNKREKKAASDAAQVEKEGVQQAHQALLQYYERTKNDYRELLFHAQLENEALRLQKQAYKKAYEDIYALRYETDALRLQKQALHKAYDEAVQKAKTEGYQLRTEGGALRMQKGSLQRAFDSQKSDMEAQIKAAKNENAAIRDSHRSLGEHMSNKVKEAEARYAGAQHEINAVRESHRALSEHHAGKSDEITKSRQLHKDLQDHHNLAHEQLAAANAELAKLKEQDTTSRQLHKDLNDHHALAHKQLALTQNELESLKEKHAVLHGTHDILVKKSSEAFSKQEEDFKSTRQKLEATKADHEAALKREERLKGDLDMEKQRGDKSRLDQAAELDKARQGATSAQTEKSSLESKLKDVETQKAAHLETMAQLSNQLNEHKDKIARMEKEASERRDSAMNGIKMEKIDSPQQGQEAPQAVHYNTANM